MSIRTHLENYRTLRQAPMWKLLASDTGPLSIALLQTLFRKSYSKLLDVFSDFFPHFTRVRAAFSKVGCIQLKPLEGQ